MAIQYDKLNEAYSALRTLRQTFLDGIIDAVELAEQVLPIKANIRELLGLPPV